MTVSQATSRLDTKPNNEPAFNRVYVDITPNSRTLISWEVNSKFPVPAGIVGFYIEVARAAGEWTRLNPGDPETELCVFVDDNKYKCNMSNDVFYRVIMVILDGSGATIAEYTSSPEATLGVWNTHDWLEARDIIRKEYLRLERYVGTPGFLMKRRVHGVPCTECRDWDTNQPTNSWCDSCFGTGFVNGYYNALPYFVDTTGSGSTKDTNNVTGTIDPHKIRKGCRSVAYPRLDTYDLWATLETDKRYVIMDIDYSVELRGKPLVYAFQMNELSASRVEHTVPLEQEPPKENPSDPDKDDTGWKGSSISKAYNW